MQLSEPLISYRTSQMPPYWSTRHTITPPESPPSSSQHRERCMIQYARSTVQTNHRRHNQESRCNNPNGVLIAQSNRQNGRSELPSCSIEGIAEPVGYQRPDGPFTVFAAYRIKICQMSLLAGQNIRRKRWWELTNLYYSIERPPTRQRTQKAPA